VKLDRRDAIELLANPAYKEIMRRYGEEISALTYDLSHNASLDEKTRISKIVRLQALEEFVSLVETQLVS